VRFIVIAVTVILVIGFAAWRFRGGKNRFPFYEFFSRGRREGFSFKEIRFLKRIAIQNRLEKPQSIFWSTSQLDRCLRPAILKIKADEKMDEKNKLSMITKLLELRKKAEFNLPKYQKRIRDTTALLPRQKLVIKESSYGTFVSWVIEINRKYLVVTQPSGQKGWETLEWRGKKVSVSFWRQEDAGYSFETRVQEQIAHEEYPLLYLAHSSSLSRDQLRKSVRVGTSIAVRFYSVLYSAETGVKKPYISKKLHVGKIIDLSESGCCMLAGRMLKKNDRVKLEFSITDVKKIVALGLIVNVSPTGDERVKKYHLLFVRISPTHRNNLSMWVYNIFGERPEDSGGGRRKTHREAAVKSRPQA
jgi:c-di-GMP-binding flagellar brake protein YcgR